jgi:hypothetical protein
MSDIDVYEELAKDIVDCVTGIDLETAKQIVSFLSNEDIVDYDGLKELYLYNEEDEE